MAWSLKYELYQNNKKYINHFT